MSEKENERIIPIDYDNYGLEIRDLGSKRVENNNGSKNNDKPKK